jgi:hypothetical protein
MGARALGFTRQLWARPWWALLGLLVYTAVLAVLARVPGAMETRASLFMAALPVAFGGLFLLAAFTFPEGDVLGRHSSYPTCLLTLPARTWELVLWPMLSGSAAAILAWVVPVACLLRPLGVEAPLLWPAIMIAACLVCLQALMWSPTGLPFLRVMGALIGIPALITAGIQASLAGVPEPAVAAAYGVLGLLAYAGAVVGLQRARTGEVPDWRWRRTERTGAAPCPPGSFLSAARAQLWFEWRSAGLGLPVTLLAVCLLTSLPLLWVRDLAPLQMNPPRSEFGSIEVNLWVRLQQSFLLALPLFAAILGCGRRRYDTRRRDLSLHPFLGTRPVASTAMIAARLRAAALGTLAAWGIVLLFVTGWLLLPARDGDTTAPLLFILARYGTGTTPLTLLLIGLLLVVWTWKSQVQGLFADVSGRGWLVYGAPLLAHGFWLAVLVWVMARSTQSQPMDPRYLPAPPELPWVVGIALVLKTAGALAAATGLLRRRLVAAPRLALWIGAWALTAGAVFALLSWLNSPSAQPTELAQTVVATYLPLCSDAIPAAVHTPGYLAAYAVLFVPLARLLAAPLALNWSRHR